MITPNNEALQIICRSVGQVLGEEVNPEEVLSRSRFRKLVWSRLVFMHLYKKAHPRCSLAQVGALLKRDHSTVIHAQRKINDLLEFDAEMKQILALCEAPCLKFWKYESEQIKEAYMSAEDRARITTLRERYKASERVRFAEEKIERILQLISDANRLGAAQGWIARKAAMIAQEV